MGKIEDMRRLREQQFAEAEERRCRSSRTRLPSTPAPAPPAVDGEPQVEAVTPRNPVDEARNQKAASPLGAEATCPGCGKTKPLQGDVMASHQKGFGKACPGSRKKPS